MHIQPRRNSRILQIIFIVMMLTILSCATSASNLTCTDGSLVTVPAEPEDWRTEIFTPTDIEVKKGDNLLFTASGAWNLGLGSVGPDGKDDWCECTISEPSGDGFRGPVGALIGRIGNQRIPFIIGSQNSVTADGGGMLYLGSNENMGPCNNVDRGSCYEDNTGTMNVCVEIK